MTYQTYEFTAYREADLLGAQTGSNISCGDVFTLPDQPTLCISVTDDDPCLSGDCYDEAKDHKGQHASITGDAGDVGNGRQIYAEQYHVLKDADGNVYYLIEIEQEGDGQDYFTFWDNVPPAGTELTVVQTCNVGGVAYDKLGAGEKGPAPAHISGRFTFDADGNDNEWNDQTHQWDEGIEGVTVQLLDLQGNVVAESVTDSYGNYSFEVPAGEYQVQFPPQDGLIFSEQNSGVDEHFDSDADANGLTEVISVAAGQKLHNVDAGVKEVPVGTVSGTIFDDLDEDGLQAAGGSTLGANLFVNGGFEDNTLNNSGVDYNVSTGDLPGWFLVGSGRGDVFEQTNRKLGNAHGDAVFELDKGAILCQEVTVAEAGTYVFSFDVFENCAISSHNNRIKIFINGHEFTKVIADGQQTLTFEIELHAGVNRFDFKSLSECRGKGPGLDNISLQQNIDLPGEPGVPNVLVTLVDIDGNAILDENNQPITTTTDADGNYSFGDIPVGDYRVLVAAPEGKQFTFQNVGNDDSIDSDVNDAGLSDIFSVTRNGVADVDGGIIEIPFAPVDDTIVVFEDEDAGDTDGDVFANDNAPAGAVVATVNGVAVNVGMPVALAGGGLVTVNADGTVDFDANDDFEALNDGETETVTFTYAVGTTRTLPDQTVTVDFNSLSAGDIVSNQFAGVTISSPNASNPPMIFDSANPTGGDKDLRTSNLGNVLILSEDGDSSDPDDEADGGVLVFTFDEPSDVQSLTFLDIEENDGKVRLFGENGLIAELDIPRTGNNGQAILTIDTDDVTSMEVVLPGSGAVDDLIFTTPGGEETVISPEATVTVVVNGLNDGPVATDNVYAIDEQDLAFDDFDQPTDPSPLLLGNVITDNTGLGVDSDPNGDPITLTAVNGQAANINTPITIQSEFLGLDTTVFVTSAGDLIFNDLANFQELSVGELDRVSFEYTITDGNGGFDTAEVTVIIDGVNDNPDAKDSMYQLLERSVQTDAGGNPLPLPDVTVGNVILDDTGAGKDFDVDGDPLVVSAVNGVTTAVGQTLTVFSDMNNIATEVTVQSDGTLIFNDLGGFEGLIDGEMDTVSFTYSISDGQGGFDTANVSLEIGGVGAPPAEVEYNIAFLIDSSASTQVRSVNDVTDALEPVHGLFNGLTETFETVNGETFSSFDLNRDGVAGSSFDAELLAAQRYIDAISAALDDTADLDLGVFTFDSALGFTPGAYNELPLSVPNLGNGETITIGANDAVTGEQTVEETQATIFDQDADLTQAFFGLGGDGVAVFNAAIDGAVNFFDAVDDPNSGGQTKNLLFVFSDSFGFDWTFGGDPDLQFELNELAAFMPEGDTLIFSQPDVPSGQLQAIDAALGATDGQPAGSSLVEDEADLAALLAQPLDQLLFG